MTYCQHDAVIRQSTPIRDPVPDKWVCLSCGLEFAPAFQPGPFRIWREVRRARKELERESEGT